MRYHCFIPWWAPVSWDMTLMKPCVCAPRKLERSFLGGEDLQFGSLYFTTLVGFFESVMVNFLSANVSGRRKTLMEGWSMMELLIPYFRERRGGSKCGSRDEWNVCVFFFFLIFDSCGYSNILKLDWTPDTQKVTSNVRRIATCSSEGWDVSATSVQPAEAFRYLYL